MRLLIVSSKPWDARLGVGRELIEYERLYRRAGHEVDHFAYDDAFPRPPRLPRISALVGRDFAGVAGRQVARVADRYDVIEALQGSLPQTREQLGFGGLLVMRSCGLQQHYDTFTSEARRRWPETRGRAFVRPLRRRRERRERRHNLASIRNADLVSVLNEAEVATCRALGAADKTVLLPHGLEAGSLASFERASNARRQDEPVVAFVGTWSVRKGSKDLPAIVGAVSQAVPRVRFLFLGTGADADEIRAQLPPVPVEVVPSFEPEELPELLARATVGLLPSYVEGYPVALLEMLAAELPVVAYDIPGVEAMLRPVEPRLLVAPGDLRACSERLVEVLRDEEWRRELGRAARASAGAVTQEDIAERTLSVYAEAASRRATDRRRLSR